VQSVSKALCSSRPCTWVREEAPRPSERTPRERRVTMWSPAECGHCGYEIQPVQEGNPHGEPHATGWVHQPDMVGKDFYCNCEGNKKLSHHSAHPADNRSVEQEYHGANELMAEHDLGIEVSKIMNQAHKNLSGEQFHG